LITFRRGSVRLLMMSKHRRAVIATAIARCAALMRLTAA
jgi:hypothetical protein